MLISTCAVCGRPEGVGDDECARKAMPALKSYCYRLGYEREKARADLLVKETAEATAREFVLREGIDPDAALKRTQAMIREHDRAEAGQRFKTYVHGVLDAAGVPTHPDGPHSKEGCRVGDRLDILVRAMSVVDAVLREHADARRRADSASAEAVWERLGALARAAKGAK